MENLLRNGDASTANIPLETIDLPFTTLSEIATILQNGMSLAFREVNVDISACPCLAREPFNLAGTGLNGNPSIIQVGDYASFIPTPRIDIAKWNIKEMLSSTCYDSFIIGSGYAAQPYMPYNGHLIMNAMYKAPNITNASRIIFADSSNGQRRIEMLTEPNQMMCSFMGNFFVSEGRQGNVLRVLAKGRISDLDIISIMQNILFTRFYDEGRPIALGGVLRMRNGRVAQNVMAEQYPSRVPSFIDLARSFQCHDIELESDLIAVGTIINTDLEILSEELRYGSLNVNHDRDYNLNFNFCKNIIKYLYDFQPLPKRHHQFHSFSNYGAGGQFVNDITKDTIEYEGYFNLASKIYMWD
ncbi:ester hydrolase C11orf54 homolog [Temnothorax nylanderi]|uniref:ester hydrolase C11orf54 homolog n=1 Tax=Temnothorax nylanderi TaxID=102681 RepID=UPI003A84FEE0